MPNRKGNSSEYKLYYIDVHVYRPAYYRISVKQKNCELGIINQKISSPLATTKLVTCKSVFSLKSHVSLLSAAVIL